MPLAPNDPSDHARVSDLLTSLTREDFERHDPPAGQWVEIAHRIHDTVDISLQPNDGDASHSGKSVMRGTLD